MGKEVLPFATLAWLLALWVGIATAQECEPFLLGGRDVRVPDEFPDGDSYANALWRKQIGKKTLTTTPFRNLKAQKVGVFAYEYRFGQVRGIGVRGGYDREITGQQGIRVDFGTASLSTVTVGVRALFVEDTIEKGRWRAFRKGDVVAQGEFSADIRKEEDGRQRFSIFVEGEGFDALDFSVTEAGSDYHLEYIEGCIPSTFVAQKAEEASHISTSWTGAKYDFHGACDLVLISNPGFLNGLGMDIHVRTKVFNEVSFIESAVMQIGYETFEIQGDEKENRFWLNGVWQSDISKGIAGHRITYRQINAHDSEFVVEIGRLAIFFKKHKQFIRIEIDGATESTFGNSVGLLGAYSSVRKIGRDKETILYDSETFGQEWQVLPTEAMLFHSIEGPQAPEKCTMPRSSTLRRRSSDSLVTAEEAVNACRHAGKSNQEYCVFDVMALNDLDLART